MVDNIAGFLFDNATKLMPLAMLLCLAALLFLVRRWPSRLWARIAAGMLALVLVAVAGVAGSLLYAERNIRSILQHRVGVLTLHPLNADAPARVADLRGKVVLVNFWATWCPPCRAEMPDLNRLAGRFPSDDVCILTITDEPFDRVKLFEQKVTPLRTLVATFQSDEPHGKLATTAYQGRPTTVILDRDGRVQEIFIGQQSYDRLERAIQRHLRRRV